MWSSGSALISFWISECLALSLRLKPDTLQSKLISVACIPDPDGRWRLECRSAVKQRAWLSAVASSQRACLDPSVSVPLHFSASWEQDPELLELNLLPAHQATSCQLVHLRNVWKPSKPMFIKIVSFFWFHFGSLFVPEFSLPMLHCQEWYGKWKWPKWLHSWRCNLSEVSSKMQHVSKASLKIPLMEQNWGTLLW